MTHQTLGRYRIVEALGEGGMGVVYRADDPRLERTVAIKVLRPDAIRDAKAQERFRQEARALSRLLHPGIATLFDFDSDDGVEFLVLEYVPGETLSQMLRSGPLPESRARAIAIEIAEALQAAHEQGIVHRDLKPGNVVVTPRGRAKVLDFGLARFLAGVDDPTRAATVDDSGSIAGTISYMAPEQLQGRADARTDQHALGVVLFEMLAGRHPFAAPDLASVVYRIAHESAPSITSVRPGISPGTAAVIARCMEKEPARRFAEAAAIARALRGEAPGAGPGAAPAAPPVTETESGRVPIRSIAVLPFANRSGDPAQEFFADGMTDALIADLAQIRALRVISRTSAMRFKGTARPLHEIAEELRVEAVVEGSAIRAGDRVRITVQLVDAINDRGLWAKNYERDLTDILTLQGEVARAIAEEIRIQVTPEERERLEPKGPVNPEAHVAYLQGRFLWNRWNTESLIESIRHYETALAADPGYALACAGLADSYSILGNTHAMAPEQAYPRAREAAEKGLAIDPSRAELHASLGYVLRFYDWDWPGSERALLHALDLNPGYATARRWYAQFLSGMGRFEEAIAEAERSLEQDPLSLIIHSAVGDVLFFARRYERAEGYYRRCLELDPAFGPGLTDLSRTLDHMGRTDEAIETFIRGTAPDGNPKPSAGLAALYARAGRRDEAFAMIESVLANVGTRWVSPYGLGSFYAAVGDNERALEWLERAYEQRDGTLIWVKVHPRMDPLRGEERYRRLLAKMKLDA